MKKSVIILVLLFMFALSLPAEISPAYYNGDAMLAFLAEATGGDNKIKFKGVIVESGRGPITSGLDLGVEFKNSKETIYIRFKFNKDRGYGLFTYDVLPFFSSGLYVGFFKGLPIFGPNFVFKPVKGVSIQYRHTWGFGEVDDIQLRIKGIYDAIGISLNFGIIKPSFRVSWFQGEQYIVSDLGFYIPFVDGFDILTGIGYEFNKGKIMFRLGLRYSSKNKKTSAKEAEK